MMLIYLFRVSKGVRGIPGSFQSASGNVPSAKSFMYFGVLLASGVFFIFIAFTMFLPVIVLAPQKFGICFTIGCALIVGSFFALKGPRYQLVHMFSREVYFFTSSFMCSHILVLPLETCHLKTTPEFKVIFYLFPSYSLLTYFVFSEAAFYIGFCWQHGGNHLCFHVASQLCSFRVVFLITGITTISSIISLVLFLHIRGNGGYWGSSQCSFE